MKRLPPDTATFAQRVCRAGSSDALRMKKSRNGVIILQAEKQQKQMKGR